MSEPFLLYPLYSNFRPLINVCHFEARGALSAGKVLANVLFAVSNYFPSQSRVTPCFVATWIILANDISEDLAI